MALPRTPDDPVHRAQTVAWFTTSQVARMLGVSPRQVRTVLRAAGLRVRRRRRRLLLGFRDVVVVRAALRLRRQQVPWHRLGEALRRLREQLPPGASVSGVRLLANGEQVLAQRGQSYWQVDSGQLVFPFAVPDSIPDTAPAQIREFSLGSGNDVDDSGLETANPAERWYSLAVAREEAGDVAGARQAYLTALRYDPSLSDAYVNLGRLAHQAGRFQQAANWYRRALEWNPNDPIAHYDLAIALEDLGEFREAIVEYQRALRVNWDFPEAHFNLSRLYRAMGRELEALRHMKIYYRLTGRRR